MTTRYEVASDRELMNLDIGDKNYVKDRNRLYELRLDEKIDGMCNIITSNQLLKEYWLQGDICDKALNTLSIKDDVKDKLLTCLKKELGMEVQLDIDVNISMMPFIPNDKNLEKFIYDSKNIHGTVPEAYSKYFKPGSKKIYLKPQTEFHEKWQQMVHDECGETLNLLRIYSDVFGEAAGVGKLEKKVRSTHEGRFVSITKRGPIYGFQNGLKGNYLKELKKTRDDVYEEVYKAEIQCTGNGNHDEYIELNIFTDNEIKIFKSVIESMGYDDLHDFNIYLSGCEMFTSVTIEFNIIDSKHCIALKYYHDTDDVVLMADEATYYDIRDMYTGDKLTMLEKISDVIGYPAFKIIL